MLIGYTLHILYKTVLSSLPVRDTSSFFTPISKTDFLHPSPIPDFTNFQVFLFSEISKVQDHNKMCSKCRLSLAFSLNLSPMPRQKSLLLLLLHQYHHHHQQHHHHHHHLLLHLFLVKTQIYFWNKTVHVSDSSSVHHQEFITVHTANLYGIYRCCVYNGKLLIMDRGTVRNMQSFIPKINLRN